MTARRDIIIQCDHGLKDAAAEYVTRFRWITDEGVWDPDPAGVKTTYVGRDLIADPPIVGYVHRDIRCKHCSRKVSVQNDVLFWALQKIESSGTPGVTIDELQAVLRNMPRGLKRRH